MPGNKVCFVHTDITRATPNDRLLLVVIHELESAGIASNDIINGLGTHRFQTNVELVEKLGKNVVKKYRFIQHNLRDDNNLVPLGYTSKGIHVRIN